MSTRDEKFLKQYSERKLGNTLASSSDASTSAVSESSKDKFLRLYNEKKNNASTANTDIGSNSEVTENSRVSKFLEHYNSTIAPKKASQWYEDSSSIINNINSQYDETSDEKFYDLDDDTATKIDDLINSSQKTIDYLNYLGNSGGDFDSSSYISGVNDMVNTLNEIKNGTYGQKKYEYNGGEYTYSQLQDKKEEAKSDISENKKWYDYIPVIGDVIGDMIGDYRNPELGDSAQQKYESAQSDKTNVENLISSIDQYNTYSPYKDVYYTQLPMPTK